MKKKATLLPAILGSIICNVLIPDTLLLGMHPFQESVYEGRLDILFNPRVQYVDMLTPDEQKELPVTTQETIRDLKRRTFTLKYGDADIPSAMAFVLNRQKQYSRMIFDWSSICGVNHSILFWQNLLKTGGYIYIQGLYELELHGQPNPEANIPGGMTCEQIEFENVPAADSWFVNRAKHPFFLNNPTPKTKIQRHERTDKAVEAKKQTVQASIPLSEKGKKALLEKARSKWSEYESCPSRFVDALIGLIDVPNEGKLRVSTQNAQYAINELRQERRLKLIEFDKPKSA